MNKNTTNSENSVFGKPSQKHQSTYVSGRNGLYKPSRVLLRGLVPVEPPLRPRQGQEKFASKLHNMTTFIERSNSHLAMTQHTKATTEPRHLLHSHDIKYSH